MPATTVDNAHLIRQHETKVLLSLSVGSRKTAAGVRCGAPRMHGGESDRGSFGLFGRDPRRPFVRPPDPRGCVDRAITLLLVNIPLEIKTSVRR